MCYVCSKCKSVVIGEKQNRVVTKVRPVAYHRYVKKMNRETREEEKVFVSQYEGTEIVSEDILCSSCVNDISETPEMVGETKHVEFTYKTSKFKRELMRNEERDSHKNNRRERDCEDFKEKYGEENE